MLVHKHRVLISMNEAKRRFHVSVSPALLRRSLLQARRAAPYRHARKKQYPASRSARRRLQTTNKQTFRILLGAVQFHLVVSPHPVHDVEGRPLWIPLKQELQESRDCIARYLRVHRRRQSREQERLASGNARMDCVRRPFENDPQPFAGTLAFGGQARRVSRMAHPIAGRHANPVLAFSRMVS